MLNLCILLKRKVDINMMLDVTFITMFTVKLMFFKRSCVDVSLFQVWHHSVP